MFSWTSVNVHDPQKPLFLTLDTPNYLKQSQKQTRIFSELIIFEISKSRETNIVEKMCAEQLLRSVSSVFENLEYGTDIFQKT